MKLYKKEKVIDAVEKEFHIEKELLLALMVSRLILVNI